MRSAWVQFENEWNGKLSTRRKSLFKTKKQREQQKKQLKNAIN